jgi:hypothetical protein
MAHAIRIKTDRWPLVIVDLEGAWSDLQFEQYIAEMTDVLMRDGFRTLVYDATKCTSVTASQRKLQAEWLTTHGARIRECTGGLAFVLPSPLVRGVLTAILWMSPLPAPHAVVASLSAAEARCQKWLDDDEARDSP